MSDAPPVRLTEFEAQNRLYAWLALRGYNKHQKPVVPNYKAPDWWQADIYALSEAGLAWEFEVKLTVPDFRADAKKARQGWLFRSGADTRTKHDRLEARCTKGPARFSYAMPMNLVPLSDIPAWAGLVVFDPEYAWSVREVRKPPLLHSTRVSEEQRSRILRNMYYRFWSCRLTLGRALRQNHKT